VAPPSTLDPNYPSALESVLLKALEKNPERRWDTADAMRIALEQAVPDAFGDTGRARLREFMERVVGDRKIARREAVRRAQLAADARDIETGNRQALQSSSAQSASSLRAIAISQTPFDATGEHPSIAHTQNGQPAAKKPGKAPWIVAGVGVALALVVTLPRLLSQAQPPVSANPGRPAGVALPAAAAAAQVMAEPTPEPVLAPAPPPSVASSVSSAPASPVKSSARSKAAVKKAVVTAAPRGASDLLAPDY
jgi:serine/threonine-protein kinase